VDTITPTVSLVQINRVLFQVNGTVCLKMGLEQIDIEHEHKGVKLHVRVTTLLFHTVQYHYHDQLQFTIISVIDALCS